MRLLVIRHAIAVEPEEFAATGGGDDERPLTREGAKRMRAAARGLVCMVPEISLLGASPLLRAQQTAEIVAHAYDGMAIETVEAMRPESPPSRLAKWLREHRDQELVAVVGHEPHVGRVASWFLAGGEASFVVMKKGAACLLELEGFSAGKARLLWALPPGVLRRIG